MSVEFNNVMCPYQYGYLIKVINEYKINVDTTSFVEAGQLDVIH